MQAELQLEARSKDLTPRTIQARFEKWHAANPQVYAKLVELARELKGKGFNKMAIGCLYEVTRWHHLKELGPLALEDGYRLNDHYRSRYARLIQEQEPDLAGVFELREIKTP